jgi:fructose-1,6-bisphosphatase-3
VVDGITYPLADTVFPTVDAADPYRLTIAEEEVMTKLQEAFIGCEKLQRHMRFFLEAGGLYQQLDDMLLFHACVPLNADGSLLEADVYGELCKGKHLYEVVDAHVKNAFFSDDPVAKKRGLDLMWWLWLSPASPLFAKSKMATFELYLIADKAARKEVKNPFYTLRDQEGGLNAIFEDFGLDPETAHIVCGHVPVKVKDGEDPIKCEGLVVCVDGGWSKAYQPTTGVAGFTLIRDERGLTLATHESFAGREAAITQNADLHSTYRPVR